MEDLLRFGFFAAGRIGVCQRHGGARRTARRFNCLLVLRDRFLKLARAFVTDAETVVLKPILGVKKQRSPA